MEHVRAIANERLKDSFGDWFWTGTIVAVVAHFLFFAFSPEFRSVDVSWDASELTAVELPPEEIDVPPPPRMIPRPATPVVSARADVAEDVTIAPTTFFDNPISELPPLEPAPEAAAVLHDYEVFTPRMVRPVVRNVDQVARAMQTRYPPVLREAGIGGTTLVRIWLDEDGVVQRAEVGRSSGFPQLDDASLRVIDVARFSPAMNRDRRVRVVLAWPITWIAIDRS